MYSNLLAVTVEGERGAMKPEDPGSLTAASRMRLVFICCGIAFACYSGSYMRLPLVPLFARSLGGTTAEVGMINSAFLLMAGLLSLPLGLLSDKLGRKFLLKCGLLVLASTSMFLYYSQTPLQMFVIYLFFGIGLAASGPTMMSLVADLSPPTHLGRAYGWYTTAIYGGMSLGPGVGGGLAQWLGYRNVFLISGGFLFLIVWMVMLFLPSPQQLLGDTRQKPSLASARRELLSNRPLWSCWLATLGGCFGLGMFVTFMPLHAHDRGLEVSEIGLVFGIQALCNALSRIPFGQLSDRVRDRSKLVVWGFIGFALSLAGFALARQAIHFMLLAISFGIAMGFAFTPLGALISEVVPPAYRGLAMGGYNTCIYFGMMLSSAFMGAVIARIGFDMGFVATALVNLSMSGIFYLAVRHRPSRAGTI
jgi:MFS family permease